MASRSTLCSVADGTAWGSDCMGVWHLSREQVGGALSFTWCREVRGTGSDGMTDERCPSR